MTLDHVTPMVCLLFQVWGKQQKSSYDCYELCDLGHANVWESRFYICKMTVMVFPNTVTKTLRY